jgi:hypothetical protein
MIRGPGSRQFDEQPPGSQFVSKPLACGLKRADVRSGQKERAIPGHLLRSVGESSRQWTKPMPSVCHALQLGLDGRYRVSDRGFDLPQAICPSSFRSQVLCASPGPRRRVRWLCIAFGAVADVAETLRCRGIIPVRVWRVDSRQRRSSRPTRAGPLCVAGTPPRWLLEVSTWRSRRTGMQKKRPVAWEVRVHVAPPLR